MASAADRRLFWTTAVVVVGLDFVTKLVAEAALLLTPGVPVIGDWFQLRLVYNRGAAFGLHVGPYSRWVFFAVAVIAVYVLNRMSLTSPPGDRFRQVALGLVAGGAAGNLIDRVRQGFVVDFVDAYWNGWHFWAFNVADAAISIGVAIMILDMLGTSTEH